MKKLTEEKHSLSEEVDILKGKIKLVTTNMKRQEKDMEKLQEKLSDDSSGNGSAVMSVSTLISDQMLSLFIRRESKTNQDGLPVGCVPTAAVAVLWREGWGHLPCQEVGGGGGACLPVGGICLPGRGGGRCLGRQCRQIKIVYLKDKF